MPRKKQTQSSGLHIFARAPEGALRPRAREHASTRAVEPSEASRAIYAVVRAIPRGKVATYGQIAELAGIPNGHRIAARCMRECPPKLPWHRVVGKKDARRAQINLQDAEHAALQRTKLELEGVYFDDNDFITLRVSGWLPN